MEAAEHCMEGVDMKSRLLYEEAVIIHAILNLVPEYRSRTPQLVQMGKTSEPETADQSLSSVALLRLTKFYYVFPRSDKGRLFYTIPYPAIA